MKLKYLLMANSVFSVFASIACFSKTLLLLPANDILLMTQADVFFKYHEQVSRIMAMLMLIAMGGGVALITISQHLNEAKARKSLAINLAIGNGLFAISVWMYDFSLWSKYDAVIFASIYAVLAAAYLYCWWLETYRPTTQIAQPDSQSAYEKQIQSVAAQQERNRLARDLHDSIKQQIFSININAATAETRFANDPKGAQTALAAVRTSAHEAMAEMEAMLQHLRPAPLETVGLIEALRKQGEALQYRTGAQVTMELGALPDNNRLSPGSQEAIFRIAQEAFANIARHARASNVKVQLYEQNDEKDDAVWLKISDDGKGFNSSTAANGMGLTNMRARAQEFGGTLHIESAQQAGTHLSIRIPFATTQFDQLKMHARWMVFFIGLAMLSNVLASWRLQLFPDWRKEFLFQDLKILVAICLLFLVPTLVQVFRYRKSIRQILNNAGASPKTTLEVNRFQQQYGALLMMVIWTVHQASDTRPDPSTRFTIGMTLINAMFIGLSLFQMHFVNQTLRKQAALLSPIEFSQSVERMWRQAMVCLTITLPITIVLQVITKQKILWLLYAMLFGYIGFVYWWRKRGAIQ